MIQQSSLDAFVAGCQIGDCLHWWGGSWLSRQIERQTGGGPSHVSMVRRIDSRTPEGIVLVESTVVEKPKRFCGVVERPFSEEYNEYQAGGGASGFWCPLAGVLRARDEAEDWTAGWANLADQHVGDPYSYAQMVLEAYDSLVVTHHIPILDMIATDFARGNWHAEFCSQLWCLLFQAVGILSASRIPGLTAPKNSWQAAIYDPVARQILGAPLALKDDLGYNSVAA